jgi:tol-pal system protein YbgF
MTMKPTRPALIAVLAGFVFMLGAGALAQTPMDDPLDARDARRLDRMERVLRELRAIVFQGRDTGQPVVVQPAGTDQQVAEMGERVGSLEQTLQRLNGTLDSLAHDLQETRRDLAQTREALAASQQQNQALTQRLAALEQQVSGLSAPPPDEVEAPPPRANPRAAAPSATAEQDFAAARRLLLAGDYAAAEGAFSTFLDENAESPRAAEARYYYGKTLLARRAYQQAASAFLGAIREWPQTSWAPDAVLDLSRALYGMNNKADACRTLGELSRRYPRASQDVRNRAATLRTQAACAAAP